MHAPDFGGSRGSLNEFALQLGNGDVVAGLQQGLIGSDAVVEGPWGARQLLYADYTASGRALMQVERFILERVLPYYANTHTQASFCGEFMTRLREEARTVIASCCGAGPEHAVIFTGSGATSGLNRLTHLLGVRDSVRSGRHVRVILGPYEHHSNILPWRESGAEIMEVAESQNGGPDETSLAKALASDAELTVCAFSAASNVTGIITDVAAITRMAKAAGALMVWDYAGGGPYLDMTMSPEGGAQIDAIAVSPHKFIGGPGASGVLIVRRDAVRVNRPTWPGGGTVRYVSAYTHDYSESIETREEAGSPNTIGDIRAALAFLVKEALGGPWLQKRSAELTARAVAAWSGIDGLELLGPLSVPRLPVFSFVIRSENGEILHHQLITRLLSDAFGIQARGGCACAGPYVHRLLGIDPARTEELRRHVLSGSELAKPGFTRLNLSPLLADEKVDFILDAVARLVRDAPELAPRYACDERRAIFFPKEFARLEVS